jgi:hypothetical protein
MPQPDCGPGVAGFRITRSWNQKNAKSRSMASNVGWALLFIGGGRTPPPPPQTHIEAGKQRVVEAELGQIADAPRIQDAVQVIDLVLHDPGVKIASPCDRWEAAASKPV